MGEICLAEKYKLINCNFSNLSTLIDHLLTTDLLKNFKFLLIELETKTI